MSAFPIRRFVLELRARYHLWSGRRCYRLGHIKAAGRHFQDAIAYGHESFEAFLLLGKIRFRMNDFPRAAQSFERARRADPEAYLLEGFPEDFIAMLRRRPSDSGRPEFRILIETPHTAPTRKTAPLRKAEGLGDFTSRREAERHKGAPPIRPGDGSDIDWDAEAKRLFGD